MSEQDDRLGSVLRQARGVAAAQQEGARDRRDFARANGLQYVVDNLDRALVAAKVVADRCSGSGGATEGNAPPLSPAGESASAVDPDRQQYNAAVPAFTADPLSSCPGWGSAPTCPQPCIQRAQCAASSEQEHAVDGVELEAGEDPEPVEDGQPSCWTSYAANECEKQRVCCTTTKERCRQATIARKTSQPVPAYEPPAGSPPAPAEHEKPPCYGKPAYVHCGKAECVDRSDCKTLHDAATAYDAAHGKTDCVADDAFWEEHKKPAEDRLPPVGGEPIKYSPGPKDPTVASKIFADGKAIDW